MASSSLLRSILFLRLDPSRHRGLSAGFISFSRQSWTFFTDSGKADGETTTAEKTTAKLASLDHSKSEGSDYQDWKEKEEEIRRDIDGTKCLAKDILHSHRYKNGERLTVEDEKAVMEKLLAYHPQSEDKIGCGIDSIMVDRHPQYRSRCLFVVRTDGGWEDFSYKKCLYSYIRDKHPEHAERFISKHFRRSI